LGLEGNNIREMDWGFVAMPHANTYQPKELW